MPRASKKPISPKVIHEISQKVTDLISALKTQEYISNFLETFFTDEEKVMISKRLMLYILIEKGLATNQITEILGVSRQTVLTHKKNWLKSASLYKTIINKMGNKRGKHSVWTKISDALYPLELVMESRSNMQARAKLYQGDLSKIKKSSF